MSMLARFMVALATGGAGVSASGAAESGTHATLNSAEGATEGAAAAAEEEEDLDLSQSLKFSSEQLAAHKAARHLFDAEEQMYGAHAAACARAAEALPAERAMADGAARGEGDADAYAAQLRETIAWKQRELDALMKAVGAYEAAAKAEDAARKNVRGVVTVGQG